MKVTSTRTIHVEMSDKEAGEITAALSSVLREVAGSVSIAHHIDKLLVFKTELANAPR